MERTKEARKKRLKSDIISIEEVFEMLSIRKSFPYNVRSSIPTDLAQPSQSEPPHHPRPRNETE